MSASISFHGPISAGARLITPTEYVKEPFVTIDIKSSGTSIALVAISPDDLEALSAALGEARVMLAGIKVDPPGYEPDDGEAQRIAEVYADARAELDRGL